jgi:DNA-binding LacI/PurR family transcriptional regulator
VISEDWWTLDHTRRLIDQHRPDAIICHGEWLLDHFRQLDIRVPDDIGYCDIDLGSPTSTTTGVYQDREQIAMVSLDLLCGMMDRAERGALRVARSVHIEGIFVPGTTLRHAPG